jgi:hypothetical protein
MDQHLAFTRLIHSDWSVDPCKRWTAVAVRTESGWHVEDTAPTPPARAFLADLFDKTHSTLAGFDFAIGLPSFYIERISLAFSEQFSFPKLLVELATERWAGFFSAAASADEITLIRPFYPHRSAAGVKRQHLVDALGCGSFDRLLRECDRATIGRSAASSLLWTLGAKQVGKAALCGWSDIVMPARARGARLWPFDGPLVRSMSSPLTLAETYPAESYRHVGINLRSGESKRSQPERSKALAAMPAWCESRRITLSKAVEEQVTSGFGPRASGEDPFDAFVGLIAMIEIAEGRRAASPGSNIPVQEREGWILGQTDLPIAIRTPGSRAML